MAFGGFTFDAKPLIKMDALSPRRYRLKRFQEKHLVEWIDPRQNIPKWMSIKDAGDHFYSWGILFHQFRPGIRRSIWRNPYLKLAFMLLYLARSLFAMTQTSRRARILLGDYPYFIKAGTHINVAAVTYMSTGLSILVMNYIRFGLCKKPDFLECYDFLASRRPPISVLLFDRHSVAKMIVKSRSAIFLTEMNTMLVGILSFFLSFLPLINACTTEEIWKYAIPWSIIFSISSYYTFGTYWANMCYFYILCHYLKHCIRLTNQQLERCTLKGRISPSELASIRKRYEIIGNNIFRYNGTYWSQVLFIIVMSMGIFASVCLYTALFIDLDIIIQTTLFYAAVMSYSCIYFALNTASVVRNESQKSVKILNRLYASVSLHQRTRFQHRAQFRLMQFLESVTKKRLGFYLLNLFIINYFRFYEIVGLVACFFLKLIEISRTRLA